MDKPKVVVTGVVSRGTRKGRKTAQITTTVGTKHVTEVPGKPDVYCDKKHKHYNLKGV